MNKSIREQVYNKYDGHCAYCGQPITMREMQVDHLVPLARGVPDKWLQEKRGTNDIDNLMPACRMCNFYKGRDRLDLFRWKITKWLDYKHTFATRFALRYGILVEKGWTGEFYFEKVNKHG
jgi:5-methylcytosine-specific restriction endonuclease McrA